MLTTVRETARELRSALSAFEPADYSGADCAVLAEELAATEKACAAGRLLAAARAVAAGAHKTRGYSEGAAWLAAKAGSTGHDARKDLALAGSLGTLPETKAALLAGEVSVAQAEEIARSDSAAPGAEGALLPLARSADLTKLREKAREHREAQSDPVALHARQLAAREFRHWRDGLGMVCFAGALTPEAGLPFLHRIEGATEDARREARKAGVTPDTFTRMAADALAALVAGAGAKPTRRAELVIVCDLYAFRRGHAHPGEAAHVIGGGRLPVEVVREASRDAFLKAVLHDGVAIHTVKHFGRHLSAELRTALELGPVPAFSGPECADCGSRFRLQYDHVDPLAHNGPTTYDNLQPRCFADHREKTERDRQAGLLRSPLPP